LLAGSAHLFTATPKNLMSAVDSFTVQQQALLGDYTNWKSRYAKIYSDYIEVYRFGVYVANKMHIEEENMKPNTYSLGENQFMDLTREEFIDTYLTLVSDIEVPEVQTPVDINDANFKAINWVTAGGVSPIKNQGSCGSCYAFSVTGAIESAELIQKTGTSVFAEQQIVDCSRAMGNLGCNGGSLLATYQWVKKWGIDEEKNYPYTAKDGTCKHKDGKFHIEKYHMLNPGMCKEFAEALKTGPVSVAVDASNWHFYKEGIFSNCGFALNHGVLIVGVDDEGNWLVKNSWDSSWGEKGFIRLAHGDTCGICIQGFQPENVHF